ncbi:hypothetical protein Dvina_19565 [Dactylosporangium vinaceum]|uniref:Uncharacterized protein n=1 Tax=Dactylosporangium vinaceum TaxID=53362 RepID=A0ABV5M9N4_9ACTN|nr:hypothetical protein [Dactylosporangium vinaceum]UAC00059.1 hypothetical protein Dvina_19565 [Dactylosporangium vinaceum]
MPDQHLRDRIRLSGNRLAAGTVVNSDGSLVQTCTVAVLDPPALMATGSQLPSVRALVNERIIFNYRLPADYLKRLLPVAWLTPQLVDGSAVASVCVLRLSRVTAGPFPSVLGVHSVSSARRYGVLDERSGGSPAVFVSERTTNSALGSLFTAAGFSAQHDYLPAAIGDDGESILVTLGNDRFTGRAVPASLWSSSLFPELEDFSTFLAEGVRSYGTSRREGRLTILDLFKEDRGYQPLAAREVGGSLVQPWLDAGAVLDSVARTTDAKYRWTYHGLTQEP